MIYGARNLNDNGSVLGLNIFDLIGAVGVMVVTSEMLRPLRLEFLSVLAGAVSLAVLIPIRMKYRRKIIRDTMLFFLGSRRIKGTWRRVSELSQEYKL
ncbi:hypothetical protein WDW86_10160 [Bdellovibrionota bacterium FG-2]